MIVLFIPDMTEDKVLSCSALEIGAMIHDYKKDYAMLLWVQGRRNKSFRLIINPVIKRGILCSTSEPPCRYDHVWLSLQVINYEEWNFQQPSNASERFKKSRVKLRRKHLPGYDKTEQLVSEKMLPKVQRQEKLFLIEAVSTLTCPTQAVERCIRTIKQTFQKVCGQEKRYGYVWTFWKYHYVICTIDLMK